MAERSLLNVWGLAASTVVIAATPAWVWGPRVVLSVLVGGAWNLASVWCLARLLGAWLGPQPSTRRAIAWLFMKGGLLAFLLFGILRSPAISVVGLCIGFTVALVVVVGNLARRAQRIVPPPVYPPSSGARGHIKRHRPFPSAAGLPGLPSALRLVALAHLVPSAALGARQGCGERSRTTASARAGGILAEGSRAQARDGSKTGGEMHGR